MSKPKALTIQVDGGYDSEGLFVVGVNSGSERVGFGASNQFDIEHPYKSVQLSLTPGQAFAIGRALIDHSNALTKWPGQEQTA